MPAIALGAIAVGSAVAGGVAAHSAAGAMKDAAGKATNQQLAFNAKNNAALTPYTNLGKNSADKLAFLMGEKSPSTDTSSVDSQLSGMTPQQALQAAQTMGSDRVSSSREMTQQWAASGVPFHVVNGIAVKDAPAAGADGTNNPNDPAFGSLLKPMDATTFQQDPGFQFRQQQGEQALARAAAAKGSTFSGGALKAADTFNSGLAAQEFSASNDRYNQNRQLTYNFLNGGVQTGLSATNTGVNANERTASAINDNTLQAGQAQAAGDLGIGNAISNGLNGIGNAYVYSQMPAPTAPAYPSTQPSTTGSTTTASLSPSTLANLFRIPSTTAPTSGDYRKPGFGLN